MTAIIYYLLMVMKFFIVVLIGIALISIVLYYISENFNLKFINIYGFFSNLDDLSLVMLSSSILKEISLIYCVMRISTFSNIYLYVFMLFGFTYAFLSFNVLTFIKEMFINTVEYLIIFFLTLLSMFLSEVRYSKMVNYYIWILSVLLIACSIFFFVRNLSYILTRNKYVRRNISVR